MGEKRMRTDFVKNIKAYRNILCFLTVIAVLGSFAPVFAESVVYNGFAGQYQHIYVNGLMLRAADGKIIADNQATGRDMRYAVRPFVCRLRFFCGGYYQFGFCGCICSDQSHCELVRQVN